MFNNITPMLEQTVLTLTVGSALYGALSFLIPRILKRYNVEFDTTRKLVGKAFKKNAERIDELEAESIKEKLEKIYRANCIYENIEAGELDYEQSLYNRLQELKHNNGWVDETRKDWRRKMLALEDHTVDDKIDAYHSDKQVRHNLEIAIEDMIKDGRLKSGG